MFLPDHEIALLGERLVQPFRPEYVEPASLDLCLGGELMAPFPSHNLTCVDMAGPEPIMQSITVDEQGFVLHPGEFVLGATEEMLTLPDNITGKIIGKSSLERFGLAINLSAGWIDPGYRGRVTFGIVNFLRVPIILRPGKKVCQIAFAYVAGSSQKPYAGRYQDSDGVVAARK